MWSGSSGRWCNGGPMIDRSARENLAERLRKLASGSITNFKFDARARNSRDRAVREVEWLLAWPRYDDTYEHTLTGEHALTLGVRRDFARAVLFLKTDCEYRWRREWALARVWRHLKQLVPNRRSPRAQPEQGDLRVWPFWSFTEYRRALRQPPYLRGVNA